MQFQFELTSTKDDDKISSYCGSKQQPYPDRRSMGFPFDRPSLKFCSNIKQFLHENMLTQQVTIIFDESHDSNKA